jgi:transposase
MDHICTSEKISFWAGSNHHRDITRAESMHDGQYATRCSMSKKRQRRDFTDEFKNDAVKLVIEQGYSCSEVGRRLGVNHTNISRWVRMHRDQLENRSESGSVKDMEAEVKRLRKENKRLLMEREILKKAAAFFANESK